MSYNILSPELKDHCLSVLDSLNEYSISRIYLAPVNPEADRCPDYLNIITQPMDLGTVRKKLESDAYKTVAEFKRDLDLIWSNSVKYNGKNSLLAFTAFQLQSMSKKLLEAISDNPVQDWAQRLNSLRKQFDELVHSPPSGIPAPGTTVQPPVEIPLKSKVRNPSKSALAAPDTSDNENDLILKRHKKPKKATPSRSTSTTSIAHSSATSYNLPPETIQPAILLDDRPPFNLDQMTKLAQDVSLLTTEEQIRSVLDCIKVNEPELSFGDELEIDVDRFSKKTHYALQALLDQLLASNSPSI